MGKYIIYRPISPPPQTILGDNHKVWLNVEAQKLRINVPKTLNNGMI